MTITDLVLILFIAALLAYALYDLKRSDLFKIM